MWNCRNVYSKMKTDLSTCLFMETEASNGLENLSKEEIEIQTFSTIGKLCGAQTSLLVASEIASSILGRTDYGLGTSFNMFSLGDTTLAILSTIPIVLIGLGSQSFADKIAEVRETAQVTQFTILTLLGPERNVQKAMLAGLAIGLTAGITEEIMFRGLLQTELSSRFGDMAAVTVSSLVFGVLHASTPLYALLAGLTGAYFSALYLHTNNLAVPMISHALYDAIAVVATHIIVTGMSEEQLVELRGNGNGNGFEGRESDFLSEEP